MKKNKKTCKMGEVLEMARDMEMELNELYEVAVANERNAELVGDENEITYWRAQRRAYHRAIQILNSQELLYSWC